MTAPPQFPRKADGVDQVEDVGCYASFAQDPVVGLGLVARGTGDAGTLIKSIQLAVWRFNKNQGLDAPMTIDRIKEESLTFRRLPAMLLGAFALVAMLLACTGIYGVLSFVTAWRKQELGIRAALGALARMVVGRRFDSDSRRNRAWLGRRGRADTLHSVDALRHRSGGSDDYGDGSRASSVCGLAACVVPAGEPCEWIPCRCCGRNRCATGCG
jgi:hypothetical protein